MPFINFCSSYRNTTFSCLTSTSKLCACAEVNLFHHDNICCFETTKINREIPLKMVLCRLFFTVMNYKMNIFWDLYDSDIKSFVFDLYFFDDADWHLSVITINLPLGHALLRVLLPTGGIL